MSRRVDQEILQRTWDDNRDVWERDPNFQSAAGRFIALRKELQASSELRMLEELPDAADESTKREWQEWKSILQPFLVKHDTWLTAPWMVTEFYVYRRMIEAIGYWDPDSPGYRYDPFAKQKRAGLESSVGSAEPMLAKIPDLPKGSSEGINLAASIALWGNKMDLSLWPADAKDAGVDIFSSILEKAHENLLHDDSPLLAERCETLRRKGGGNVDIIVDNAGFELITDLALAQYLVDSGIASCVTFQLKSHPTFVSDAMEKDLLEHVEHYAQLDGTLYPNARQSGEKWKEFLRDGRWKCHEDNFWVQAFAMWDMTEPLRTDLKERCDLAFVKGDANYRRLLGEWGTVCVIDRVVGWLGRLVQLLRGKLTSAISICLMNCFDTCFPGDCKWDMTADFDDVVGAYFPCPVCALRTLKAEIGCGMDADQIERAKKLDDNWQVNGRFGVVHFGKGADSDL